MDKTYTIYEVLQDGVPCYVGLTIRRLKDRLLGHCDCKTSSLFEPIERLGREHFTIKPVFKTHSKKDGFALEAKWTEHRMSEGYTMYNKTVGSGAGKYNNFYGVHNRGEASPRFGVHLSNETKEKISKSRKEFYKNGGVSWSKGKKLPTVSQHRLGKKATQETLRKMQIVRSKIPVRCVETGEVYFSACEAFRSLRPDAKTTSGRPNIIKACNNPSKVAYGYHWEYV